MRALKHSIEFFQEKYKYILLFSIPFFIALIIPLLVSAPTYIALGGVFLRTGSIPELGILQVAAAAAACLASLFIISDSIVNINLIIKAKKTLTKINREVVKAMGTYAVTIFLVYVLATAIILVLQLLTFDFSLRGIVLPVLGMAVGLAFFFVPPAVVIDDMKLRHAMAASVKMVGGKIGDVVAWILVGTVAISVSEFVFLFLPHPFGIYFTLLFNSIVVIPFLLIYQTFIYMKKYPLAH
jgi:hypothetical protein